MYPVFPVIRKYTYMVKKQTKHAQKSNNEKKNELYPISSIPVLLPISFVIYLHIIKHILNAAILDLSIL